MTRRAPQKRRPRRRPQVELDLRVRTWGGARQGAGRKPSQRPKVRHRSRPPLDPRKPLHVTLRVVREVGNLRQKSRFNAVRDALRAAKDRLGLRLVHFSVQTNHLHLIVEATDQVALMRALKGLSVRLARAINRIAGRKGRVFADRYHFRALATPREVKNALAYVLSNARKHAAERGRRLPKAWLDPCSSAPAFTGWRGRVPSALDAIVPPMTWLLAHGWRRRGLLEPEAIPGP